MKIFRNKYVTTALSLFTGIIFLNMSFILVEITALKIDRDQQMARNLSMLVASSVAEEEPGGTADEDASPSEIDLIFNHSLNHSGNIHPTNGLEFNIWSHGHPRLAEFEICNPPPEA